MSEAFAIFFLLSLSFIIELMLETTKMQEPNDANEITEIKMEITDASGGSVGWPSPRLPIIANSPAWPGAASGHCQYYY